MLTSALRSKIDSLWDKFWSGGLSNPLTAIEQISYLLFMKRLDEADLKNKADAEWLDKKHTSVFEGKEEYRWSRFKHLEGGEMLSLMQEKIFPFIKTMQSEDHPFTKHMKDAVFIIPKPSLLVEAVNCIDEIYAEIEKERLSGQTFNDTQGDVYEYLLSEIASAGKNGQFRTPRHIIQMICSLINPRLGEEICDPACGTGGFLLGAYQHILTEFTSEPNRFTDENCLVRGLLGDRLTDSKQWKILREKTFNGYDFDTTMIRIGLMNLTLHGIDHPHLDYADTLSKRFNEDNRYEVILANPPFKGSIDKGDVNETLSLKTTKTELLFVNRIINMLTTGGRAGVIVPDGVLFGSSNAHRQLREMLLDSCELQGIVSMPSGVFKPYAGVSTAVLIFTKGGKTENVWFYDMTADGRSLDDKRTRIDDNDIPDIIEKWNTRHSKANDPIRENSRDSRSQKKEEEKESGSRISRMDANEEKKIGENSRDSRSQKKEEEKESGSRISRMDANEGKKIGENSRDSRSIKPGWDRTQKFFFVSAEEIRKNKYDLSINRYKETPYNPVNVDPPEAILKTLQTLETDIQAGLTELEGMLK